MKTRIGIIGSGCIGCFVGAHLIKAGAQVTFLGRKRFGDLIAGSGLTIDEGFFLSPDEVHFVTNNADLPELDVVIFTTKSQDTESSAKEVASRMAKDALIISFQNGLRNKEQLQAIFPKHTVLAGMVPFNVIQVGEKANFRKTSKGNIYIESKADERLQAFTKPLFELVNDIEGIQWGKLLRNLNNALNALSDRPLLRQLSIRNERLLLSGIVTEALGAMKKNGIKPKNTSALPIEILPYALKLPDFLFYPILRKEVGADPFARLSMWQDLELGRKTEIDYLNGEVLDLGFKTGVAVPLNQKIVTLIKLAEMGQVKEARKQYSELVSSMK